MKRRYKIEFRVDLDTKKDNPSYIGEEIQSAIKKRFLSAKIPVVFVISLDIPDPNDPDLWGNRDFDSEYKYYKMFPSKGNKAWYKRERCTIDDRVGKDMVRINLSGFRTMKVKKFDVTERHE